MGRYYNGDIKGKFWFGVQGSDDADFFGVDGTQLETLNYCFELEDLENVDKGVVKCFNELGRNKELLDEFFEKEDFYNNKELKEYLNKSPDEVEEILKWYARLRLGLKIQKCIEDYSRCYFEAEL